MKRSLSYAWHFAWRVIKYALLLAAAAIILILIMLAGAYRDLYGAAKDGLAGKESITASVANAQNQDWTGASAKAAEAQAYFSSGLDKLDNTRDNPAVKNVGFIGRQVSDLEYLLKTAEILSRAVQQALIPITALDEIRSGAKSGNFADLPEADKARFLRRVYESGPELRGLKADIDLAVLNLGKIHKIGILWPFFKQIGEMKGELAQAANLTDRAGQLVKLLPAIAGYPETSRFLVIMQNNDELRATGGFIGVYGLLEVKNGQLVQFKADDSYHLDMPASQNNWNMEAPAPLKKYLDVKKWYLRDANWSPDWPIASQKIVEIYNGENKSIGQSATDFSGVIAINPDLVADLINLVGPITVQGSTYDANNFQTLLQYNVEVAYKEQNISSWDRKEVINELIAELKNRLFNLSASSWAKVLAIVDDNIITKDIQLYFPRTDWEELAKTMGAGGEIKVPASDYVMVVDSNFGAFKSDAVMKKNISYTVKEGADKLEAALKLNYRHEGGFDWRTTRYRSYTRVYAPLGSRLAAIDGLNQETADISTTDDPGLQKTVFSFFWTVEPGTAEEATVRYELPAAIKGQMSKGEYTLLVQKQSGSRIQNLSVSINSQLIYSGAFAQDKEIGYAD